MTYLLDPTFQFVDESGNPLVNGCIEVYNHETRDKVYTYADFDGTLNEFKVRLNSLGQANILVDEYITYDIFVYDAIGSLQFSRVNVFPSDMFVVVYDKEVDPIVFTTDKPVFVKYQNYLITLANRTSDSLTFQQITGNETDGYRFIQILYKDGVWSVPQDREITFDEAKEYIKETAEVIITPNVKKNGGLSLTSEGSAHITEKTGLSFEVPFVQLKQEPWNNTSEKVGLSFEISYLSLEDA